VHHFSPEHSFFVQNDSNILTQLVHRMFNFKFQVGLHVENAAQDKKSWLQFVKGKSPIMLQQDTYLNLLSQLFEIVEI